MWAIGADVHKRSTTFYALDDDGEPVDGFNRLFRSVRSNEEGYLEVRRYLDYTVDKEGRMHMVRKQNAFAFADNRARRFVMLSSTGTTWEQMMTSYDVRDWVEKTFDMYKTDLDGGRFRTGSP